MKERLVKNVYDGVIIAFFLPSELGRTLVLKNPAQLPKGTQVIPADELHITMCHLGKIGDKRLEHAKPALQRNMYVFAEKVPPISGKFGGLGVFVEADGTACLHLTFDCPELLAIREELLKMVGASCGAGYKGPANNHIYNAHVTLAYFPPKPDGTPDETAFTIAANAAEYLNKEIYLHTIHLAWGNKLMPYTLQAAPDTTELKKSADEVKQLNTAYLKKITQMMRKGASATEFLMAAREFDRALKAPARPVNVQPTDQKKGKGDKNNRTEFKLKAVKAANGEIETVYKGMTGFFIEGWASVRAPADRYGDFIGPTSEAFQDSVKTYFQLNPILLYEHGLDTVIGNKPLGQVVGYKFVDDYGLWVRAFVRKPIWEPMLQVYYDILAGILRTFSIGGIWERYGDEIIRADLFELSVVATPAQPYAVFDLATKSFVGFDGKYIRSLVSDARNVGGRKSNNQLNQAAKGKKPLSPVEHKQVALTFALAGLSYWTEEGERIISNKAKFKSVAQRDAAIKLMQGRIKQATNYVNELLAV